MTASPTFSVPQDGDKTVAVWSKAHDNPSATNLVREASRMSDDITTKVRKPYTITKQRERWTDEEHQKFIEAVKLYGRAWRQIEGDQRENVLRLFGYQCAQPGFRFCHRMLTTRVHPKTPFFCSCLLEHVGTKTAVQIRSHAQKFFSKLEREGSSGGLNSKGPVLEIDIPPPRPKRKPAHPYPRKDAVLGRSANMPSRPMQLSENKSSGQEDAISGVHTRNSTAFSNNEPDAQSSEMTPRVIFSPKIRKRGTEEVQGDAFHNESQDMQKLSKGNSSDREQTSSPLSVPAQTNKMVMQNNNMPFGVHGSKLLAALHHHMALAYNHPVNSLSAGSPSQHVQVEDIPPVLAGLITAHAQLSSSLMPWIAQNPVAMAAAAAAAATGPWPGFRLPAPPPLPLHLPVRPPFTFNNQQSKESTNSVAAAAMAAAAAASLADASAWLALHGTMANPPIVPEVRSNPFVQSAMVESQKKQHLTDSSEGSKNGDNTCEQISSEQEVTTMNDIQVAEQYTNNLEPMVGNHSLPSVNHIHAIHDHDHTEDEEKLGHNSSTDSSSKGKKGRNKNGLNGSTSAFVLAGSNKGIQKSYLTVTSKKLEKVCTEVDSSGVSVSLNMYQSSNSPGSGTSTRVSEGSGEDSRYDNSKKQPQMECHMQEECDSSPEKRNNHVDAQDIAKQMEQVDSINHYKGSSRTRNEEISGEASVAPIRQSVSSCGSTGYQKVAVNDSPLGRLTTNEIQVQEYVPKDNMDDSIPQVSPHEKAGKALVQACFKKWQGGKVMSTSSCSNPKTNVVAARGNLTCRAEAKAEESQHENEARGSLAKGFTNSRSQPQILNGSKASSSGSSKYTRHGFVPYRRS